MRTRGFTLIELLIVIGIIMVLMGLLMSGVYLVKGQAQKAKARTLLAQVMAACDTYRLQSGTFPDSLAMKAVFETAPNTPKDVSALTTADWTTVAGELLARLAKVDRDTFGSMGTLADPWKQVLRYRPVQYYPYKPVAAGLPKVDVDPPPRPDSFQLWSVGPNERDEYGEDGTDDLAVWRK